MSVENSQAINLRLLSCCTVVLLKILSKELNELVKYISKTNKESLDVVYECISHYRDTSLSYYLPIRLFHILQSKYYHYPTRISSIF